MAKTNILIWVLVAVGIILVVSPGTLTNLFGKTATTTIDKSNAPSDQQTTFNLKTTDALSTSPLDANVSYYIFNGDDSYYKSGTTSAGAASITVAYGKTYKILVYADSGTQYYPVQDTLVADESVKAKNIELTKVGGASISSARDPVDLNANISGTTIGSTVGYQVLWSENVTNAGLKNPIIVADVNKTCVKSMTVNGYSEVTCPSRLTTSTERIKYCFKKDGMITSSMSTQTEAGSIVFDSTSACGSTDGVTFIILDEQQYKEPNYISLGLSAFKVGAQDSNKAATGAVDSSSAFLEFAG